MCPIWKHAALVSCMSFDTQPTERKFNDNTDIWRDFLCVLIDGTELFLVIVTGKYHDF